MRTAIALALLVASSGCFSRGNGEPGSSVRDVADFHAIDVGGVFQVDVQVGPAKHVEVRGDSNLLAQVEVESSGGELRAEIDGSVLPSLPLQLIITTPVLDDIDLSGATRAKVTGITGERFEVESSGASNITLAGTVNALEIDLSGASQADASALVANAVEIDASGASSAQLVANESLDADASGASNITWTGNATNVNTDASGAASIEKR